MPAEPLPAYTPNTGWPAWAVLPAGFAICLLAAIAGAAASVAVAVLVSGDAPLAAGLPPGAIASGLIAQQLLAILLTIYFAGFFKSVRSETLALRPPRGGAKVFGLALIPLFAITGAWTAFAVSVRPEAVIEDLRMFSDLMQSQWALLALLAIGIGAPLSEELLFRGFLFSGLAKSGLGLVGTAVLTTVLWSALHMQYSIYGLIEVLMIGLYLSWLLVRTGSVWVPVFCHAVYNSAIGIALYFIHLPPVPAPVVP